MPLGRAKGVAVENNKRNEEYVRPSSTKRNYSRQLHSSHFCIVMALLDSVIDIAEYCTYRRKEETLISTRNSVSQWNSWDCLAIFAI